MSRPHKDEIVDHPTQTRARYEEDQEAQHHASSSVQPSPAMRLYRHALESIFGLLEFEDLVRILSVSREWSAAVRSMAPIHAAIQRDACGSIRERQAFRSLPPIPSIVVSPLFHHIATLQIRHPGASWTPLNNDSLALLAQHAPNLQSLWCTLSLTPHEPLILPAKLTSLHLQVDDQSTDATINNVLMTLAAHSSLSSLRLWLSAYEPHPAVEFNILAASRSLTNLKIDVCEVPDVQIDQIRLSLGHLSHFSIGARMGSNLLARLLQPPVTARWQDIDHVYADARTSELLLRLSNSLTKLYLAYQQDAAHVDFLPQLPFLTSLHLDSDRVSSWGRDGSWFLPPDAVLAALVLCKGLTELNLNCGFNSAHCTALFANLPLKKLTISGVELESLQCFAAGPITQSLEHLTLREFNLPPSELCHLYALRRLRTLSFLSCQLSDATLDLLTPPSPRLPSLTALFYRHKQVDIKRQGSSFEWMLQRMTQ